MLSHTPNSRRKTKNRRYNKLFVLSVEGWKTEPQYFSFLNKKVPTLHVELLRDKHKTAPHQILERMEDYLKDEELEDLDEAWLVIDKDDRKDEELLKLHEWSQEKTNYELALSNPCFEFWLLLHFEEGAGVSKKSECIERLKKHLPNYKKDIDTRKITDEGIKKAIKRAKDMKISFNDLLSSKGTTVYKLVENIMKTREEK